MSTITLNLPDHLLERVKAYDDQNNIDQAVSKLLARSLDEIEEEGEGFFIEPDTRSWEDIPQDVRNRIEQGLEDIKNGEQGMELEDYIAMRQAERAQRNATLENQTDVLSRKTA
jgi:hypothetical protein